MPTPSVLPEPPQPPEEHSPLSPFTLLANKGGLLNQAMPIPHNVPVAPSEPVVAPIIPPPPTPPAPITVVPSEFDREELIKQAAQAPNQTFILPQTPSVQATPPAPTFRVIPLVTPPQAPPPQWTPPVAKPTPLAPVPPQLPHTNVQMSVDDVVRSVYTPKRGGGKIFAAIGIVIGLGILGIAAYVLALSGLRIPALYSQVSGVSTSGLTLGKNALTRLESAKTYQFLGDATLKRTSQNGVVKPVLPESGVVLDPTANFNGLKSSVVAPDQLFFNLNDSTYTGKIRLEQNGTSPIPVVFHENPKSTNTVVFTLPANANTVVVTSEEGLKDTILYSILRPIPLPILLSALQKEQAYRKVLVNGDESSEFTYALDKSFIVDSLPKGVIIANATLQMTYTWHTGQPRISQFEGTISYHGRNYQLSEHSEYSNWNTGFSTTNIDAAKVSDPISIAAITPSSTADFIGELGLISYSALPHGSTSLATSTTATPSPTPSDAPTPVITSTPVPSAIMPSGASTATAVSAIAVAPPIPIRSAQSTTRDTQRKKDLHDLQSALESYKLKQGKYPKSSGIEQVQSGPTLFTALIPTYLTKMPLDPLSSIYWYEYSSDGATYTIHSVAENSTDLAAQKGVAFYYFEVQNK